MPDVEGRSGPRDWRPWQPDRVPASAAPIPAPSWLEQREQRKRLRRAQRRPWITDEPTVRWPFKILGAVVVLWFLVMLAAVAASALGYRVSL